MTITICRERIAQARQKIEAIRELIIWIFEVFNSMSYTIN